MHDTQPDKLPSKIKAFNFYHWKFRVPLKLEFNEHA